MDAALSKLVTDLNNPNVATRLAAAEAIAQAADGAQEAASALIKTVADSDDQVRQWATSALEDLGPPRTEDLAELIALLNDKRGDVVYWAATLIGRLGQAAVSAQAALTAAAAKHPAENARKRAQWALEKIK